MSLRRHSAGFPACAPNKIKTTAARLAGCLLAAVLLTGCASDGTFQSIRMREDARLKPFEGRDASPRTTLQLPEGTVARGQRPPGDPVITARVGDELVTEFPFAITPSVLERGQERFEIFCSPCHGRLGDGQGLVAQRGFPNPPDYAIQRLRDAPAGHFYEVITEGRGIMYSYASRVSPEDRWAIAAYIRVLQEARPEVPPERHIELRERARETGIPQDARGSRAPGARSGSPGGER